MRFTTFFLNAFWRSLYPLNAFLVLLTLFQTSMLVLFWSGTRFAFNDYACRFLKDKISEIGIDADFKTASFDLRGDIRIDDISLRVTGTPENFFMAKSVEVSFWKFPALCGEFRPKSLRVADARVGATYSDIEKNPIVNSLYLSVKRQGEWWDLTALSMRAGKVSVSASGFLNSRFNPDKLFDGALASLRKEPPAGSKDASAKPPAAIVREAAAKLDEVFSKYPEVKKYADMLSDPMVHIDFALCGAGENEASATISSGGTSFMLDGSDAELKDFSLNVRLSNSGGCSALSARLFADNFSHKNFPSIENAAVRADITLRENYVGLENVDVAVKKIRMDETVIENAVFKKRHIDSSDWGEDWMFFAALGINRAGGKFSIAPDKSASFEFSANVDPKFLSARKEFVGIEELSQFAFPLGINLVGDGYFSGKDAAVRLRCCVQADNCTVMNIPVSYVYGLVDLDTANSLFEATDVRVEAVEGWALDGSFVQRFDDNRYFIKLKGSIRPDAISHFMASWWKRIMGSFAFEGKGNFPNADVSVEGAWGEPEFIWCFTDVDGKNANYGGVGFDKFSMNIWVNPQRITLYDVSVGAQNRTAHGVIEWLYGADGITSYDSQNIFFESNLNSDELAALGGEDAAEVLNVVRFSQAPRITINAILRNPKHTDGKSDVFNIEAFSSGETRVDKATLSNLKFKARSDKVDTQIDGLSFNFCKGFGEGALKLKKIEKSMEFDANLFAERLNQAEFIKFLESLDPDGSEATKASFAEGGEEGSVSLSIMLKGDVSEFEKSVGSGYVNIENKDLVKLHLLGLLSRALSAVKLPFASFDITYAHSTFQVSGGSVKFPQLEMGGPVMQVKGGASYDFMNDDLDATLAITPFGGLTMPIVSRVMSVIDPITSVVQVTLKGPVADPDIGVKLNPMNMLQSDKKILKEIGDAL